MLQAGFWQTITEIIKEASCTVSCLIDVYTDEVACDKKFGPNGTHPNHENLIDCYWEASYTIFRNCTTLECDKE